MENGHTEQELERQVDKCRQCQAGETTRPRFCQTPSSLEPSALRCPSVAGSQGPQNLGFSTRLWQTPGALTQPCDWARSGYRNCLWKTHRGSTNFYKGLTVVGRASFLQACGKEIHRQPRDSVVGGRWAAERREEGGQSQEPIDDFGG